MSYLSWTFLLACSVPAFIYGGTAQALEPSSDAIVVGVTNLVTLAWPDTTFQITVEQSIKGGLAIGSLLSVKSTYPYARDVGGRQIRETHRGIWFLKLNAGGWYRCLPASPGPLSMAYFPVASSAPVASVLSALPAEPAHDAIIRLAAGALEESSQYAETFLAAAGGTDSPGVTAILHHFASSANSTKRAAGLAGLIGRKDKQALLDFLKDRKTFSEREIGMVARSLGRSTDPDVVNALGRVATDSSSPATLKESAALALSAVHTKDTLPYLAALLNSSDLLLQVHAVFGLSGFANGFDTVTAANTPSMGWLNNRQDTPYTTSETKHYLALLEWTPILRQPVNP